MIVHHAAVLFVVFGGLKNEFVVLAMTIKLSLHVFEVSCRCWGAAVHVRNVMSVSYCEFSAHEESRDRICVEVEFPGSVYYVEVKFQEIGHPM